MTESTEIGTNSLLAVPIRDDDRYMNTTKDTVLGAIAAKYLPLGSRVGGRLLAIHREARPLPRPEHRTVRIPAVSMATTVWGGAS